MDIDSISLKLNNDEDLTTRSITTGYKNTKINKLIIRTNFKKSELIRKKKLIKIRDH
jgi:hypothetical protein